MIETTRASTRRALAIGVVAVVCAAGAAAVALAGGGGSGVVHLGPIQGVQGFPWTGSCGNVWQVADYKNVYEVYPRNPDGSYTVVESQVGKGRTLSGPSPDACSGGPNNGVTVAAGIRTKEDDLSVFVISGGIFDPTGTCASQCTEANFTEAFFGASATVDGLSGIWVIRTQCNGQYVSSVGGSEAVVSGNISGTSRRGCD